MVLEQVKWCLVSRLSICKDLKVSLWRISFCLGREVGRMVEVEVLLSSYGSNQNWAFIILLLMEWLEANPTMHLLMACLMMVDER